MILENSQEIKLPVASERKISNRKMMYVIIQQMQLNVETIPEQLVKRRQVMEFNPMGLNNLS